MDVLHIGKTGATVASGAASANVAIPTNAAGLAPYYIRVAASVAAYVKLGTDNTVAAAAGDMMIQPGDAVILRARDYAYVAAIQVAAAGTVQISALENV